MLRLALVMEGCHGSRFQFKSTHQQTVTIPLIWDSTESWIKDHEINGDLISGVQTLPELKLNHYKKCRLGGNRHDISRFFTVRHCKVEKRNENPKWKRKRGDKQQEKH